MDYTLQYGTTNAPTSAQLAQTLQNALNNQGMLGPYQIEKPSIKFSGKSFLKFSEDPQFSKFVFFLECCHKTKNVNYYTDSNHQPLIEKV